MKAGEDRSEWPEIEVEFVPVGVLSDASRAVLHAVIVDQLPAGGLTPVTTTEAGAA